MQNKRFDLGKGADVPMQEKLIVIGAANPHIVRLIEDINLSGKRKLDLIGFLDNRYRELGSKFYEYDLIGGFEAIANFDRQNVILINSIAGILSVREETTKHFEQQGWRFTNLVHPNINMGHVKLGIGNIIYENAYIQPYVTIGNHCVVSSNSGIAHECILNDYCFIGPASYVCGKVVMGKRVYVAVGAKVLPRLDIGDDAIIGAGSVVVENVGQGQKILGVPGKAVSC